MSPVVLLGSRASWGPLAGRLRGRVLRTPAAITAPVHLVASGSDTSTAAAFAAEHPHLVRSLVLDATVPSPALADVAAPVLITAGAHDPASQAFAVAEELQDAHVVVFPFAGRAVPQQEPAMFLRLVESFQRQVETPLAVAA